MDNYMAQLLCSPPKPTSTRRNTNKRLVFFFFFVLYLLYFPDDMLKDSTKVVSALKRKTRLFTEGREDVRDVRFFVMADTTYGSCCIDEVGALHINAECVVHYGQTCLSPTSVLSAFFVFGKASINVSSCFKHLMDYASKCDKPIMILYGLEYAHMIPHIQEKSMEALGLSKTQFQLKFSVASVLCSFISPSKDPRESMEHPGPYSESDPSDSSSSSRNYRLGGLTWDMPEGSKIEDFLLFYIGSDNSAFANVVLTFNGCDIGIYIWLYPWLTYYCPFFFLELFIRNSKIFGEFVTNSIVDYGKVMKWDPVRVFTSVPFSPVRGRFA